MPISKQIGILITLIQFGVFCFGQGEKVNRSKIDSLRRLFPTLHGSARVDCLNELSGSYVSLNRGYFLSLDKDSVRYYAAFAYDEAKKINYIHGMAEAKALEVETAGEDFPKAENVAREAIKLYANTPNKKRLAKTYFNLGYALYAQSMFTDAIENLETSYEIYKKDNDAKGMGQSFLVIAAVYEESGNYEMAFKVTRKGLDMAIENKDDWLRRIELTLIGILFRDIEDYGTALSYYHQALQNIKPEEYTYNTAYIRPVREIAEVYCLRQQYDSARYYFSFADTSNERALRFYLVSVGEYFFLQKEYNKALSNFIRGLNYHKQSNDRNQVMRTLIDIAKTYLALQNNTAALGFAQQALSIANQTGAKKISRNGYQILHSIYDRLKKTDSAYFYYGEFVRMNDSIITDQVKGKLVAYSYEQKIELMNQDKLISQQQLNIQRQQLKNEAMLRNILIGGILAVFLFTLIMVGYFTLKRKNEKLKNERTHADLKHKATELEMQALRAQMNPHFIFNSLNSINRFILQNNKAEASEYLTKFSRLIRLILQNSQASLIPLESELESLELYLDLEALRFDHHFDYRISVRKDLDIEVLKVPPLIIQPYVENAIWHGLMHKEEKGQLDIDVSQENNHLFFKITDDGIGRKEAAALATKSATKHKSMGLRITADRIAILQNPNGNESPVTINDLVNGDGTTAGTEVIIKMPFVYD
jgi:tetratricopeptide (TPR) repeat protein